MGLILLVQSRMKGEAMKKKGAGMMMTIMLVSVFGWVVIVGLVIKPVFWVGALLCLFVGVAIGCLIAFLMRRWWFKGITVGR